MDSSGLIGRSGNWRPGCSAFIPPRLPSAGRPAAWLVSFGDLLTLLLCFVLSLICYGHFDPKLTIEQQKAIPASEDIGASAKTSGTPLAKQLDKPERGMVSAPQEVKTLALTAADFADPSTLTGQAEARMHGLTAGEKIKEAGIESCAEASNDDPWFLAMSRALSLRSRLLSLGVAESALRMRIAGSHCSEMRKTAGADKEAIALITMKVE